ncbi:hypothetical protein OROMI_007861 [Orobanche minor]
MANRFHTYFDIPAVFTRAAVEKSSPDFKYLDVEELCPGTNAGDESEDSDQEDDDRENDDDREDDDSQGRNDDSST